uniref:LOW QUALITY PROTEIN: metastasis-suppressor KiSS-1 n=1 Tax=Nyctereutes procyonoides TaxID=34880 RepID=UPI0024444D55|nr:LOW QUALITY PROTEIN: metastasis-suppressor KiSS-1 [Nyctereutes procyonoides]
MNSLVSWQLMLLLCATSFRETLEKVAPMETPGPAGQRLGPQALPAPAPARPRPRAPLPRGAHGGPRCARLPGTPQGPSTQACAPPSAAMPAPRGAVPGRGDLPTYNWNVFGLRYGRRRATTPGLRG